MAVKLDLNDWKILNQLDLNCRQSDAEIGKKVRLSKQVVNYRIKRLVNEGIITAFFPHINTAKLGYGIHKIYLQFRALTKEKEAEMWNYLIKQPNIIWVISCSGKWDLIFGIASKTIEQFDKVLTDFMNKYSEFIVNRAITVFNKATLHHRKWLLKQKQEPVYWLLGGKVEETKIDETDKEILRILNENARKPIIEIAEKVEISSSLTIQRIKKLKKHRIIGAFRIGLNREKLGMNYCKSFIYYQNKTTEKENRLLHYCYNLPNITGVSQSIGPWDLELEFEVKNYDDFHKIMKEMKNRFPLIKNFDTVYIEREYGLSYLPED
ncbi:Lrp/AsnC family transcriptional regulator [Candidatus Woesearchaeota archaeon]|nr:Lrp/AsnC family transcriptional regulator [Candidatus Woesearchaeota archaeon]